MAIIFDRINRYIKPDSESVTIQNLINAIRDFEDNQANMDIPQIAAASGKDDLGSGLMTGITLRLYNWQVKFPDMDGPDYTVCTVTGGNLLAEDDNGDPLVPVAPSLFIIPSWEKAVSVALIGEDRLDSIISQNDSISIKTALIEKIMRNKLITDPDNGQLTLYDDDGIMPLLTANLYEDVAGEQAYRGQGASRRDRLE